MTSEKQRQRLGDEKMVDRNGTHATTAKTEWFDCGLFRRSTGVAYSNAPLPVAVGRSGEVVGSGGGGVVGSSHYSSVARNCAEKGSKSAKELQL